MFAIDPNGDDIRYTTVDQSEVWFQVIGIDGQVKHMNKFAEKLSGYTLGEVNENHAFWEKLFHTRETGLRMLNLFISMIRREKEVHSAVSEIVTKSGETLQIVWSMKCLRNSAGEVTGATIIGINHKGENGFRSKKDKLQEQRYRQIFKNAPIGFFRSLPEGRFIEVNNALARLLGYSNPEEVLKEITDIGPDIYLNPEFRKYVVDETLASAEVRSFETVFINKSGEEVDVRINISSRYDPGLSNHVLEGTLEDISARKSAEKKLNQNLQKYATLFEKSPIAIWEMDYSEIKAELDRLNIPEEDLKSYFEKHPEKLKLIRQKARVIDVNQATFKLFGVRYKQELSLMQQPLIKQKITDSELRSMKSFMKNKSTFEYESVFNTPKSGKRNIILRWVAAPDTEKPYSRVLVTMIDITDQRKKQEALHKSRNELASLLSSMDDLVFIINQEGKYLYVAPTRPDLLISSAKNLEGKFLDDFLPIEIVGKIKVKIKESLQQKVTLSIDYPLTLKKKQFWFEARISPLSSENVIVVARDITERVKNYRVNEVMLNVARAISTTDLLDELFDLIRTELSKIIDTKNFFLALFDAETNHLELPYFRDEKDSFDHFPAAKTLSALVIRKKTSLLLLEPEIKRLVNDGEINVVGSAAKVWLGIPLMVEGEVLGLMVVQNYENENAITEEHQHLLEMISPQISLSIKRKQSERLLRESEKELRASNATKDRFFSIIAHDLKNPFNAIIGFSSLLTDEWSDFDDDDKIAMISSIKSSSEGAYELLMNLLEWSRLQVGKITFEPEFIDYESLIRLNFSLLRTAAEKKNIRLISSGMCDKMVWADPNMIKTVIRNLLTNAIKFTPANGTITTNCHKNADFPGMILLSIEDNGLGISKEECKTLFKLNRSESKTGTDGETGTGLGLVICKEFVEKNKGKIWVKSELGKGSTFFIALPVRPT